MSQVKLSESELAIVKQRMSQELQIASSDITDTHVQQYIETKLNESLTVSQPQPSTGMGTMIASSYTSLLPTYGSLSSTSVQVPALSPKKPEKKVKIVTEKVSFDSVVISDEKREEIKAAISQVDNTELLFEDWGFNEVFEKGTAITLLFYGIPGGGKTLMAQAIANEIDADLKIYGMAEIGSSEPGGSERFIKKIFTTAREFLKTDKKQQVVLFDECDALLYDRAKVGVILGAQINTLLSEIERHDGIIIFTTNRIGTLDPALERRIAAKIEFPFPTIEQREAIWKRMMPTKAPLSKDVDFKKLSVYPLAGGNIKNAVLNAARMAAYKKQKQITMDNFVVAIEREAVSQKAFEAEYEGGNRSRGWETKSVDDYSQTDSRNLSINRDTTPSIHEELTKLLNTRKERP